jgi:hypothetical protein
MVHSSRTVFSMQLPHCECVRQWIFKDMGSVYQWYNSSSNVGGLERNAIITQKRTYCYVDCCLQKFTLKEHVPVYLYKKQMLVGGHLL